MKSKYAVHGPHAVASLISVPCCPSLSSSVRKAIRSSYVLFGRRFGKPPPAVQLAPLVEEPVESLLLLLLLVSLAVVAAGTSSPIARMPLPIITCALQVWALYILASAVAAFRHALRDVGGEAGLLMVQRGARSNTWRGGRG